MSQFFLDFWKLLRFLLIVKWLRYITQRYGKIPQCRLNHALQCSINKSFVTFIFFSYETKQFFVPLYPALPYICHSNIVPGIDFHSTVIIHRLELSVTAYFTFCQFYRQLKKTEHICFGGCKRTFAFTFWTHYFGNFFFSLAGLLSLGHVYAWQNEQKLNESLFNLLVSECRANGS